MKQKYRQEIILFIEKNGWEKIDFEGEYETYRKKDNIGIDISKNEVIFIDDAGPFFEIEINKKTIFAMLGYLFHYRYLDINYKF